MSPTESDLIMFRILGEAGDQKAEKVLSEEKRRAEDELLQILAETGDSNAIMFK